MRSDLDRMIADAIAADGCGEDLSPISAPDDPSGIGARTNAGFFVDAARRRRAARIWRDHDGTCVECGNTRTPGFKTCELCRALIRQFHRNKAKRNGKW